MLATPGLLGIAKPEVEVSPLQAPCARLDCHGAAWVPLPMLGCTAWLKREPEDWREESRVCTMGPLGLAARRACWLLCALPLSWLVMMGRALVLPVALR